MSGKACHADCGEELGPRCVNLFCRCSQPTECAQFMFAQRSHVLRSCNATKCAGIRPRAQGSHNRRYASLLYTELVSLVGRLSSDVQSYETLVNPRFRPLPPLHIPEREMQYARRSLASAWQRPSDLGLWKSRGGFITTLHALGELETFA